MKKLSMILVIWLLIFNSIIAGDIATDSVMNVIFFIGDGMGISQITASRIFLLGANERCNIEKMPVTGLITTHSADRLITDSAAGATAMATGFKTRNGMVGFTPDSMVVKTIVEAVKEMGMSIGLIATSTITHATPACFATHVFSRNNHSEIARQLVMSDVDLIFGGGKKYFIPMQDSSSSRLDSMNLLEIAQSRGYEVIDQRSELKDTQSSRILGLFALDEMKKNPVQPSISNMTQKALEILSQDPDGFFLMVEGSQIDWAGHDNDFEALVREMAAFDTTIGIGLKFAERKGNTLVIVTADHETGGLLITGGDVRGQNIEVAWHYTSHTGQMVPLFAAGPGSHLFGGIHDNTDIPKILANLLGIKEFPAKLSSSSAQP
jgi:alkaline phosphatase